MRCDCNHFFSYQDHFVVFQVVFKIAMITSSVVKIPFVVAEVNSEVIVVLYRNISPTLA